ncbi:MAG: hypothetical protein AAGC44_12315 [Planctomycetota bacterium]
MRQTIALFIDAYHELNAKKLFWITMIFSAGIAACFFFIGINERGMQFLFWDVNLPGFNTREMTPAAFYKLMFSFMGIRIYLGIAATAIAIISTAGVFPDMIKEGAIDLLLSKPIGRLRLFLTRYATGLMFAFLQCLAFTTICFFVIGFRGGVWEPGIFLAVPLFVLFFSYLFALSVFVGVITRSTIVALLVTILLFALLIGLNSADGLVRGFHFQAEAVARLQEDRVAIVDAMDESQRAELEQMMRQRAGLDDTDDELTAEEVSYLREQVSIDALRREAEDSRASADSIGQIADLMYLIKWPLPKTGETLSLIERTIIRAADLPPPDVEAVNSPFFEQDSETVRETAEDLERPIWWIVGTSLAFEFMLVGFAAWLFCRRDY